MGVAPKKELPQSAKILAVLIVLSSNNRFWS